MFKLSFVFFISLLYFDVKISCGVWLSTKIVILHQNIFFSINISQSSFLEQPLLYLLGGRSPRHVLRKRPFHLIPNPWTSSVKGDEGCIGPSGTLLCLWQTKKILCSTWMVLFHACLIVGLIQFFTSFYYRAPCRTVSYKLYLIISALIYWHNTGVQFALFRFKFGCGEPTTEEDLREVSHSMSIWPF